MPTAKALAMAEEEGLDLFCMTPDADPPVCKIVDYGKYKYQKSRKEKEAQKKTAQSRVDQKELKMRYNIGSNDYNVRLNKAIKFLSKGDKVRVLCQFKGREMEFKEIAMELYIKFANDLEEHAMLESKPNIEGRQMVMVLAPLVKKGDILQEQAKAEAAEAAEAQETPVVGAEP